MDKVMGQGSERVREERGKRVENGSRVCVCVHDNAK